LLNSNSSLWLRYGLPLLLGKFAYVDFHSQIVSAATRFRNAFRSKPLPAGTSPSPTYTGRGVFGRQAVAWFAFGFAFVTKLLYIIPSLDYSGSARKVTLLAAGLPRERFEVRVVVLGVTAPWVDSLREAGVAVEVLGWKRPFDLLPLMALRRFLHRFQPVVIHAWSQQLLRVLALAGVGATPRIFVSDVLQPGERLTWWDRLWLRNVKCVIAFSAGEAESYRRNGIASQTVPPGIDVAPEPAAASLAIDSLPTGHLILGVGPIEMHKGFRDAVWALDILQYLYEDIQLDVVGEGRDQARVAHFAQAVGATRRVHFLGPIADLGPLWSRASVFWAPSLLGGGVCATLEAMAAGRPVVGTRVPGLNEIIVDGVTGYLVKPGDKAGLARQTRLLLDNPDLAAAMGEAGRRRVVEHFTATRMVHECERLYANSGNYPRNNP
jgi:glycosyltransferase involved in cell wall biosynthesis